MSGLLSRNSALAVGLLAALASVPPVLKAATEGSATVPDFSSNHAGWIATGNDFIPPSGGPQPVTFDPAYPYVPNNPRRQATFRVADLSNPNLKAWARERMQRENEKVLSGGIAYTPRSSCMPAGTPAFLLFIIEPIFFVQAPNEVLIIYSGDQQVRHIHLDARHSARPRPSWYGESIGHYQGDTLVIDTIGFNDKTYVDNYRTPHTDKLHVEERWRLVNDGKMLEVGFAVEDPDTFAAPWSGSQRYRRVQEMMTEQVCAENNKGLFDYHMPVAAKPDF
jgi:hypothetical protein